uniref:NADH-ubiquinone oxidoreductase chain 3 n=1 Tax=Chaetopterus variopedatus TaxID=34590 RepID=A0A0S2N0B1_CHAVR|nr:NADH dehydrogenase subunit 3 [Chaetopterus variopedatus]ALO81665.1 NADH dehydrogenase subunit 3 [Chaetopterus variopedatus]
MLSILLSTVLSFFLIILLITVSSSVSKKLSFDREKNSPFECGFDPNSSARIPFSLRFFLLAVIFLIFDIEIVLLLPAPILMFNYNFLVIVPLSVFLLVLILGLIYEWMEGSLEWAK